MTTPPLVLTFPMPPNLANRPMHHMARHRVKLGYWALLDMMFGFGVDQQALIGLDRLARRTTMRDLSAQIEHARAFAWWYMNQRGPKSAPHPVPARWPSASIRSVMHLGAQMDAGNAMNRHKWCEDWLTTRGFIADDNPKALRWDGLPEQIIKRDGHYRIVLTLSPLTEHP